jgi:dTDP-4-amino-4,6-dideoxygalactose transaminase
MEGGMLAVRDGEAAERMRRMATNGMSANAWDRYGRSAAPAPAEVVAPGYKYLMGNVSAAMGLEQLKKFPTFKAARGRLARIYRSALAEIDEISLPRLTEDVEHSWHLMIIRLDLDLLSKSRDGIAFALRQENVGTGVHFLGLHLHKYYRETLGMKPEDFPEATAASSRILSLPLYPGLTDKNVHAVVAALKKVLHHAR